MIDKLTLIRAIDAATSTIGFQRKNTSWYLVNSDTIILINLRKSTHGNYFYLDCGINLLVLSDERYPKINNCHIQFNFGVLAGEESPKLIKCLDLDASDDEDGQALSVLLRERCLPSLIALATRKNLRVQYQSGKMQFALLLWQAREILEKD